MTQFLAFSKKELLETWRTKKLVLLFCHFYDIWLNESIGG